MKADLASRQGCARERPLPANLRAWITDPHGADAYPIVTYTWLLCYKKYQDPKTAATLKSVIQVRPDRGPEGCRVDSATFRCPRTSSTQGRPRRSNRTLMTREPRLDGAMILDPGDHP